MSKIKFPSLAAALALAVAFTLSCSDDKDGGGAKITKAKITGVSQKGPFIQGSTADLYELNSDLSPTGRTIPGRIADNWGKFEITGVELASPYVLLRADGRYRNEVTGNVSDAPIKMLAITDITDRDNVNVNIFTHLEYDRVLKLVESGKSIREAKKQAQKEILAVFGISEDFKDSEDMSIFGTTDGDAALLAISILLLGNLSEGDFDKRISDFSLEFAENGTWDNEAEKTKMANTAAGANLERIKQNILAWELSSEVPAFEKYVSRYMASYYGLGECESSKQGEIKMAADLYFICESDIWRNISELEADTYGWGCVYGTANMDFEIFNVCYAECVDVCEGYLECDQPHTTKAGNVSGDYYRCIDFIIGGGTGTRERNFWMSESDWDSLHP